VWRVMEFLHINSQESTPFLLQQLTPNGDRFGDKLAQRIGADGISVSSDQQELLSFIYADEDGRYSSAYTASGAVAMNFPVPRIHHSQVALTVNDLPGYRDWSHVDGRGLRRRRTIQRRDGASLDLDHRFVLSINELTLETNSFSIESRDKAVGAMLPRSDQ